MLSPALVPACIAGPWPANRRRLKRSRFDRVSAVLEHGFALGHQGQRRSGRPRPRRRLRRRIGQSHIDTSWARCQPAKRHGDGLGSRCTDAKPEYLVFSDGLRVIRSSNADAPGGAISEIVADPDQSEGQIGACCHDQP